MKHALEMSVFLMFALLASSAPAAVLVVGGGAGSFPTIQAAVDVAVNGDIVLVESGGYGAFTIDGAGISVVADTGAAVFVTGPVLVKNVPPAGQVALVRLAIDGVTQGATDGVGLIVENCTGHVRVERSRIRGVAGAPLVGCSTPPGVDAQTAMRVLRSVDVAITRSLLFGGDAQELFDFDHCDGDPYAGGRAGHALELIDAKVVAYDSQLIGGDGGGAWGAGGDGGDGCHATDDPAVTIQSEFFASNTHLEGGNGGHAQDFVGPTFPGVGGSAIEASAGVQVRILDCTAVAGMSGFGLFENPPPPPLFSGNVQQLPGDSKQLVAPTVMRELQANTLSVFGQPGDQAHLFLSPTMASVFVPGLNGSFLLGSPLVGPQLIGVVPASGSLVLNVVSPTLPAGTLGLSVELQSVVLSSVGTATLTGPAHLTLLSASL